MKLRLFLIPVLFLLLPLVYAGTDIDTSGTHSACDSGDYIFCDIGDYQYFDGTKLTPADGDLLSAQGWTVISGNSMPYDDDGNMIGNMSIFTIGDSNLHHMRYDLGIAYSNVTIQIAYYDDPSDTDAVTQLHILSNVGGYLGLIGVQTDQACANTYMGYNGDYNCSPVSRVAEWINFTFYISPNADYQVGYANRTEIHNDTSTLAARFINVLEDNTYPILANYDGLFIWNGSPENRPTAEAADTTPPHITKYSDQGASCSNWNADTSTQCSTGDTTPSLYFNTSKDANCRIGVEDINYTTMNSSRNCDSGDGTTEHACTLSLQDELVYEDSTVYISCESTSGYENTTSTSGPLALRITGLEAGTEAAIGVGVQNALLSGYTNYTNQQIYARKLDGTQGTGTFDWVAKKGTKVWAFNHITKGEQHVGLFNLSPVLYVLEMANITNSTIINSVELMINATK